MSFKLFYYIKRFGYNYLPEFYFRKKYEKLRDFEKNYNHEEIDYRLNYYFKLNESFEIPDKAVSVKNFKFTDNSEYYLDLKDFLHYFTPEMRFIYRFGDSVEVPSFPTLLKARPIEGDNSFFILFKLNKRRHFRWVNDPFTFSEKIDKLVWRGGAYNELRKSFVQQFWAHPLCNVGQTNKPKENVPWQKKYLPVKEQLKYKFIFCPEGNDVATNLKWAMSSNSLCLMPKPRYETWFMEGKLQAGIHYVEVRSDFSDLEEKIIYYSKHTEEAEQIIQNAHTHVEKFKNPMLEDLLCLKVLEKYAKLSGQPGVLKFEK
jgi:hypothetical protein